MVWLWLGVSIHVIAAITSGGAIDQVSRQRLAASCEGIGYSSDMTLTLDRFRWPRPTAFSVLVIAILFLVWVRPPSDLDFCWQVRTGQRILATGQLRQPDPFSYTIAGKDLPDHGWLYEVMVAALWNFLGHPGLKLARVLLYAAPIAIHAWQLHSRDVKRHAIALTVIAGLAILFFFERLRPMVFSTMGLQLVAGWLYDHCRGNRPLDWKLPVMMLLWGNLHPAVIMGQALLLGAMAWHLLIDWGGDRQRLRGLILWGGLGVLATFVAPAPIDRLLYPFAPELRHPAQRNFEEIRPIWHFLTQPPFVVPWALAIGVLFAVALFIRRRDLFAWEWALLAGVTGLFITAIRGTADWFVITAALAVPLTGRALLTLVRSHHARGFARRLVRLDRAVKRIVNLPMLRPEPVWCLGGLVVIIVASLMPWGERLPNRESPDWPREAADWIEAGGLPGDGPWKVFCGYNEGAYFIWRFDGRVKVYSDTRGFFYPGEVLSDSYALPRAIGDWPAQLDRVVANGTEFFLLPVEDPTGEPFGFWKLLQPHVAKPLYIDKKFAIVSTAQVKAAVAKTLSAETGRR